MKTVDGLDLGGQKGTNAATPTASADVANKGYVDGAVRAVSADVTANNRDVILMDATSGARTVTVPIAVGTHVTVKKTDASTNPVNVVPASGTVDGDTSCVLAGQNAAVMVIADGTNLRIESTDGQVLVSDGVWRSYVPTLTSATSGAVLASTLSNAKYMTIGKTCFVHGDLTANAASTGGAAVDLPLISKDRLINCGTMGAFGTGIPTDQCGLAYMAADKLRLVVVAYTAGFRDVVSGNVIRWHCSYELP